MDIKNAVTLRIKELLEKNNMTRYALAKKTGVPETTIASIVVGTAKDPQLSTIIQIAYGFDMTLSEFANSTLFDIDNLDI